ncbi:hypothetical protein KCP70_15050 [Salmonella enterica subsp. enterica]|nr:hypothetical protein KCP70_15050 [Salmonella enterica subsp. enterica]
MASDQRWRYVSAIFIFHQKPANAADNRLSQTALACQHAGKAALYALAPHFPATLSNPSRI